MRKIKFLFLVIVAFVSVVSCNHESDITSKGDDQVNNLSRQQINIKFNGKTYQLKEDNSLAYYNEKNQYQGDIILKDFKNYSSFANKGEGENNIEIEDNTATTGEVNVRNLLTNEEVTIKNIRESGDKTIFDVETSNGAEFENIEGSQANASPIVPIIRAVVAIVSIIAVTISSGGTQADCTASMPANCPAGSYPYAEYESGWFNSSCKVGCRK